MMHKHFRRNGAIFLALVLSVLGMNAFIPAGHMLAPSAGHFLSVVPCPSTNALARAVAAQVDRPAAMDHARLGHANMDHGDIDHAALGHVAAGGDHTDHQDPASSQGNVDCTFSALASAATLPEKPAFEAQVFVASRAATVPLLALALDLRRYWRPPLRAPPLRG